MRTAVWMGSFVFASMTACYSASDTATDRGGTGSVGNYGSASNAGTGGFPISTTKSDLPCDVVTLLQNNCINCHSASPTGGASNPLLSMADFKAMSKEQPALTVGAVALSKVQSSMMPPKPAPAPAPALVASLAQWVNGGMQPVTCNTAPPVSGGGGTSGAGGTTSANGGATPGAGATVIDPVKSGLPCDVATLLQTDCVSCHGATPTNGAIGGLLSLADLEAPSKEVPGQTVGAVAVQKIQAGTMPPKPAAAPSASLAVALATWVSGGMRAGTCAVSPPPGSGGAGNAGGAANAGGTPGAGGTVIDPVKSGLPCDVATLLQTECASCHGGVPLNGAIGSLLSLADLRAPSKEVPGQTVGSVAVQKIQAGTMPPKPAAAPSAALSSALSTWVAGGMQAGSCGVSVPDAGTGSGGAPGSGGAGNTGGGAGAGGTVIDPGTSGLPCEVTAMLEHDCSGCHGSPPRSGAPESLLSYADLIAASKEQPTKSNAVVSLEKINAGLMPPKPGPAPDPARVAALSAWINGGMQSTTCATPIDAGPPTPNPYDTPTVCTSGTRWTRGENSSMRPGEACIACHARSGGEAPTFAVAGTVYPTAHEPNDCNGQNGSADPVQVIITDARGRSVTLNVNGVGNFSYEGSLTMPYTAKLVSGGQERAMVAPQTTGDCNTCHTVSGTNSAPGRIMAP